MPKGKTNPTMKNVAQKAGVALAAVSTSIPDDVQIIGFDGMRCFGNMDFLCSTIVRPMERIAETCVNLVLDTHPEKAPSLICMPASYACGGTTR